MRRMIPPSLGRSAAAVARAVFWCSLAALSALTSTRDAMALALASAAAAGHVRGAALRAGETAAVVAWWAVFAALRARWTWAEPGVGASVSAGGSGKARIVSRSRHDVADEDAGADDATSAFAPQRDAEMFVFLSAVAAFALAIRVLGKVNRPPLPPPSGHVAVPSSSTPSQGPQLQAQSLGGRAASREAFLASLDRLGREPEPS